MSFLDDVARSSKLMALTRRRWESLDNGGDGTLPGDESDDDDINEVQVMSVTLRPKRPSLTQRLFDSFESRGDVTFLVGEAGEEEEIKAVVYILRISSTVFDTMFNSTWNGQNEVIRIPDIRPDIFRHFLKLLVTDELNKSHIRDLKLSIKDTFRLLYAAKKYEVTLLHSTCIQFLKGPSQMTFSRAVLIYEYAQIFDEVGLGDAALAFIHKRADDIFQSSEFLKMSRETLTRLLKSNSLVIDEITLFKCVCRWGSERCSEENNYITGENIRKALGDLLFLIRFPLMSAPDVVKSVKPAGVLFNNEYVDLLEYIVLPSADREKSSPFGDTPRSWKKREEQTTELTAKRQGKQKEVAKRSKQL